MTNPQDIASIAEGLSDAERRALAALWDFPVWDSFVNPDINALQSLVELGLANHDDDGPKDELQFYRRTEKGQLVHAHLQEQNNEG